MTLPRTYGKGSDGAIASFDSKDLFTRIGYLRLYPCQETTNAGTTQFLTPNQIFSNPPLYNGASADFDILFNIPHIINGDVYLNYSIEVTGATSSISIVHTLLHVTAGGVETSLGTATCASFAPGGAASRRDSIKINVPLTKFKIGEKLRYRCVPTFGGAGSKWIWTNPADSSTCSYNYDPTGFSAFKPDTDFSIDIPEKLNVK